MQLTRRCEDLSIALEILYTHPTLLFNPIQVQRFAYRMNPETRLYLAEIDGLRAIAVLAVVFHHLNWPFFSGGYLGVDIFFVISGYLITQIIRREIDSDSFSFVRFYERRARRILPALILVLLASIIAGYFLLLPNDFENLGQAIFSAASFVPNIFFWLKTGYFSPSADSLPLLHLWSLGVEEQFYLVWPVALLVITPKNSKLVLAILVLASLFAAQASLNLDRSSDAFYLPHLRAWELLVGCALALNHFPVIQKPSYIKLCQAIAFLLLLVPIVFYSEATLFPGVSALPVVIATAVLIRLAENPRASIFTAFLTCQVARYFGRISYSMYLWHWPVIAFFVYTNNDPPSFLQGLALFLLSWLLAELCWRYVETRFRMSADERRLQQSDASRNMLLLSTSALLLVGVIGLVLHFNNGFTQRLPEKALFYNDFISYESPTKDECLTWNIANRAEHCLIGSGSEQSKKILIWADSHAEHLMPMLNKSLSNSGRRGAPAFKRGCAPSLSFEKTLASTRALGCDQFNKIVWQELLSEENFDHVILAANWLQFTQHHQAVLDTDAFIDDSFQQIATSLDAIVTELSSRAIKVTLFGQLPLPHNEPTKCLAQSEMLGVATSRCRAQNQRDRRLQNRIDQLFQSIAARHPSIALISLSDVLCDSSECNVLIDGIPVYRDDDHMTEEASIKLFGRLRPMPTWH